MPCANLNPGEQNDNMVIGNCRRRLTRKNKITNKEDDEERLQMELPRWPAAAPGSTENPWPLGKPCSEQCFLYSAKEGIPIPEWPKNIKNRLLEAASVLVRNARISCICAIIVNKPCREVRVWLEKVPESVQLISENPAIPDNVLQRIPSKPLGAGKRRHRWHEDYPASCFRPPKPSKDNENTDWPQFIPCTHLGPCTDKTCRCLRDHHTCEKTCCCPPSCSRRWRGCVCRKNNKPCSRQSECACLDAGRECDPDLCGSCGAIEVLDPRNRGTPLTDENCQNVNLQLGRQRRTFIGISYVGGIGLYAAEKIPKNSFLGEYTGEVISDEEGVRRHKDAEKRKLSYLFGLNRSQSADAVRAGNKLRFTNHSAQNANVGVRTTFVNGVHRITFCAEKLIYPGDELWFDYAYPPVWIKKFNLREPALPPRQGIVGRGKRKAQDSDEETEFEDEDVSEELVAATQSETRSSRALTRIAVKGASERMAMKSGNRNNGKRIGSISGSGSERESESKRSKSQRLRLALR
ncbi:SET domain-containing protein [Ascodesmis nigricans]|uniref:SET domain-containing protein n=1 Tax=Ascodesmis nigricans TaxID=341454 RepID=A0A4S2MYL1_9PEZI|nr:SET domain-containing protein [Ascodesmis nigricans]